MRFAAKYGRLVVQIQREITEAYATGAVKVLQGNVWAQFKPEGMKPFEREIVLAHWIFNGAYQEMDEATTVPPDYRIGIFDSEEAQLESAWSDETREQVEQGLQDLVRYDYIIELPTTSLPAPWPTYLQFKGTPAALLKKLIEDGYEIESVLEYERETRNDENIVTAFELYLGGVPKEEEVVA